MPVRDGGTTSNIFHVSYSGRREQDGIDGSASVGQNPVGFKPVLPCNGLTSSDFISTAFPEELQDDDELDVIVMDFALDDFCTCNTSIQYWPIGG